MNFQDIPPVDKGSDYLDRALKAAGEKANRQRRASKRKEDQEKNVAVEKTRLRALADGLAKSLSRIPTNFPNFDDLPEFYTQLVNTTLDKERVQSALASVSSAPKTIKDLTREYLRAYDRTRTRGDLLQLKKAAIGRVSSVTKRIEKDLRVLDKVRAMMRKYPSLKTSLYTVAIAGFPNVGKSTLLATLTPAKPEVNAYAFTTKGLNVGHFQWRHNNIQCVDTPGTLDREERMNAIERQALLAMKYAAHAIVYIYDLTEPYPLADQEKLERGVRKLGKDVLLYTSKTDVLDEKLVRSFVKGKKERVYTSPEELKKALGDLFEKDFLNT